MSIACCFIQREVRTEFVLLVVETMKRFKCARDSRCLNYLEGKYSPSKRFTNNYQNGSTKNLRTKSDSAMFTRNISTTSGTKRKQTMFSVFSNETSFFNRSANEKNTTLQKFCCCLFADETNDFFKEEKRRKSSNIFKDLKNRRNTNRQKSILLAKQREDAKSLGSIFQKTLIFDDQDELKSMLEKKSDNQSFEPQKRLIEPIIEQEEKSRNFQQLEKVYKDFSFEDESKSLRNSKNENCKFSYDSSLKRSQSSFVDHHENEFFEPLLPIQKKSLSSSSSSNKAVNSESNFYKNNREKNLFFHMFPTNDTSNSSSALSSTKTEEFKEISNKESSKFFSEENSHDESSYGEEISLKNIFYNLNATKNVQRLENTLSLYLDDLFNEDQYFQMISRKNKDLKSNLGQVEEKTLENLFENLPDFKKANLLENCLSLYLDESLDEDRTKRQTVVGKSNSTLNKDNEYLKNKSTGFLDLKGEECNTKKFSRKKYKKRSYSM